VLSAMISEADAGNAEEMADILEDAKMECEKHGKVDLYRVFCFCVSLISYNSHHKSRAQSRKTVPAPKR